ncbi:MAG: bifunctional metallophosphatase/5'-nucleotidase [Brevefilum sp.]|nr:bifunctional metallophosphatase/5'-nucleotidase [Brevefilum sp.]
MDTRKFTILHSNDMHGNFIAEVCGEKGDLIGGLSLLSGYINQVRQEEENVLYVIAGDMVQGSIIDTEYKGISTMSIMNYLSPDVVTLGNHEFDYGLSHLLFLEKVANFPIVNANLYITQHNKRLLQPYHIIEMADFKILFIGIITEMVLDTIKADRDISSFITLEEAANEVGKITNAYKHDDIDLTILLTHIGFDADCELAALLDPDWGVDMIIGGHSHTILEQPAEINGVLVTQAGEGTKQIGRFDIVVDDDTNSIVDYDWKLMPITGNTIKPDQDLQKYIDSYREVVDTKYNSIVCKLSAELTHPTRTEETTLGNLFADAMAEWGEIDVMLLGSGSIRVPSLGPLITLGDFLACFPFTDSLTRFSVTGAILWRMFSHWMRPENRSRRGECYQVNHGVRAVYNNTSHQLESLSIDGQPVRQDQLYTIGLQGYHASNCEANLNVTLEELRQSGRSRVVATCVQDLLLEYLREHQNFTEKIEGRLVYR